MRERIEALLGEVNEAILDYDGDNMIEDGIISSFDIVNIITAIDDEFDIDIPAKSIVPENFANKNAIISMVEELLKA